VEVALEVEVDVVVDDVDLDDLDPGWVFQPLFATARSPGTGERARRPAPIRQRSGGFSQRADR
jgi:hypothetical protein